MAAAMVILEAMDLSAIMAAILAALDMVALAMVVALNMVAMEDMDMAVTEVDMAIIDLGDGDDAGKSL